MCRAFVGLKNFKDTLEMYQSLPTLLDVDRNLSKFANVDRR